MRVEDGEAKVMQSRAQIVTRIRAELRWLLNPADDRDLRIFSIVERLLEALALHYQKGRLMRYGPFFKYVGSKWILSKYYPAPKHDTIVEPFAGSACYATRYLGHSCRVFLYDNNPEITRLWGYLINVDGNEIANLPVDLPIGEDIRKLGLPNHGAELLVRQWQRVGISTCWTVSKWGNKPGQWTASTRDRVAASVERIRDWVVYNDDYRWAATHSAQSTFFVDPPYYGMKAYYLHDCRAIDYDSLARWCKNLRGQVIVTERASATWLPFTPFRNVPTGRRGKACLNGYSIEGIWTNE